MSAFYIASLKHTSKGDEHITWWRPFHRGYTPVIERAGKYCFGEAVALNDGVDYIAVPTEIAQALASPTPFWKPGAQFYDHTGPVVDNTRSNWNRLVAGSLLAALRVGKVRPEVFRGKRRSFAWVADCSREVAAS